MTGKIGYFRLLTQEKFLAEKACGWYAPSDGLTPRAREKVGAVFVAGPEGEGAAAPAADGAEES